MNATGHLTSEEAASFARSDGKLSASECLAISDHAAACDVCRAQLAGVRAEQGERGARPELTRVFAGLIEAGRQEDGTAQDRWTGAEEFSGTLPGLTPSERMEAQTIKQRMSQFEPEVFVPGRTLAPMARGAVETARTADHAESGGWWQRLFSWQGLTLTGAMAVLVLTAVMAVPRLAPRPVSGPVAGTGPKADLMDGPVQVSADGHLAGLTAIPADLREAVLETVRRGAAPGTLLGKLTRGGGTDASAQSTSIVDGMAVSAPVSPVSTSVETDQPVFRWKAAGPAQIVVRPSAGGEEIRSLPLPAGTAEWTPPTPLPRGALYRWQIVVLTPGGEEITGTRAGAVFKVLSPDAHERLEALRAGAAGRSHLALGVAYAREGLKEEAAREFRALRESNAQSALAKRLVDSVEGRRS